MERHVAAAAAAKLNGEMDAIRELGKEASGQARHLLHSLSALHDRMTHMDFKGLDSLAQAYKLNGTILGGYNFVIDGPKKKPDNNKEMLASVVIGMVVPVTEGGRSDRGWVETAAETVMDVMGDDLED